MNEKQKESIRKEAKEILDSFARKLEGVKFKEKKLKKGLGGFREEGAGEKCDPEFRKRMFDNAPNTEGDFLVAEKKKW